MPSHDEVLATLRQQISSEPDADRALALAVGTLKKTMPDYAWVGIYLLDGNELVLGPFEGRPSPHTHIPLGRGICGAAAAELPERVQLAPDRVETGSARDEEREQQQRALGRRRQAARTGQRQHDHADRAG